MKVGNKNRYKGLCANNDKYYHSKDFSKSYHPKPDNKPPKPCKGHLRKVIRRQCNRKFKLRKNLINGCVVDLCSNVPIEIDNLAKKKKKKKLKKFLYKDLV